MFTRNDMIEIILKNKEKIIEKYPFLKVESCCDGDINQAFASNVYRYIYLSVADKINFHEDFDILKILELAEKIKRVNVPFSNHLTTTPKTINKHSCINCSLKHISSAVVIITEILDGYNTSEYRMYLTGNLNEAQEQITALHSFIAHKLRLLRIEIFEITKNVKRKHLLKCMAIYRRTEKLKNEGK